MTKRAYILCCVFAFVAVCFMCVGYASVSNLLNVSGTADVPQPVYDTLVITDVAPVNGTTITSESHYRYVPTNIKSVISGAKGQQIVYRITAHNYSEKEIFIYNGIKYDTLAGNALDKMTVSISTDANGNNQLLVEPSTAMCIEGTPIAPGEEFVFYATYTLTEDVSEEEVFIHYSFDNVIYTVTYLNNNHVWAIDCIVNNDEIYHVRDEQPDDYDPDRDFVDWVNANAVPVDSYPAKNTHSYTLSAKWDNLYLIMFVDKNGNVLYQEIFTDSSKALSASGQETVNQILAKLNADVAQDDMTVTWSEYNIQSNKADTVVRPLYTYHGNLRFTPIDRDGDGIIDYYQVDAVSSLDDPVKIPGQHQDLPVEVVNKLYKNEGNFDFGAGIKTIEIGEGVKTLNHNSLAYTSTLTTVKLPSTITSLGKNVFSRNTSGDKKQLTIEFNGTMAEWQAIVANSHGEWHNGLKDGSRVNCSDGYFELDRGFLGLGGYDWNAKSY